jgi:hypothetical protein
MASIAKFDTWQNSAGTTYGTVLNSQVYFNTTYTGWTTSAWFDLWSVSYTPVSASSTITAVLSLNYLNESSNSTDTYVILTGGTGLYYYGAGKAGTLSGWNMNQECLIYSATNSSTTAKTLLIQARGNGTNMSYFNYNYGPGNARSSILIQEFAR